MPWLPVTADIEGVLNEMARTPPGDRQGRIHDVQIKTLTKRADERGYFIEQLKRGDRDDQGRLFIPELPFSQMSRSLAYARGAIPRSLSRRFTGIGNSGTTGTSFKGTPGQCS